MRVRAGAHAADGSDQQCRCSWLCSERQCFERHCCINDPEELKEDEGPNRRWSRGAAATNGRRDTWRSSFTAAHSLSVVVANSVNPQMVRLQYCCHCCCPLTAFLVAALSLLLSHQTDWIYHCSKENIKLRPVSVDEEKRSVIPKRNLLNGGK